MNNEKVLDHLRNWWHQVGLDLNVGKLYVFGSTIYQNGKLLDPNISDLDIVTVIPISANTAVQRTKWLNTLAQHKQTLELELVKLLKRKNSAESIVSFTPITQLELFANVHKSKDRDFYSSNEFLDLSVGDLLTGLPDANSAPIGNEMIRQVLEYCQGVRNKFLAVSAIADEYPLEWKSDTDTVPKDLMRSAAKVASVAQPHTKFQERFDVRVGLDHLNSYVFTRRNDDLQYLNAYDWITVRRGGRGDKAGAQSLRPEMHLFLSEVIFDLSAAAIAVPAPIAKANFSLNSGVTAVAPTQASAIPVDFLVGQDGHLRGDPDDLQASVAEASVNIKWRRQPYFSLTLEELQTIEQRLTATPCETDARTRKNRAEALDRQQRLHYISSRVNLGFQLLIYYQNIFFRNGETRANDLLLAMASYSLLCAKPEMAAAHFNGPLVAYIVGFVTPPIVKKIQFGVPPLNMNEFLLRTVGKSMKDNGAMCLAAENQPLIELNQSTLASHFVPLLVKAIVDSGKLGDDAVKNSSEDIDTVCDLEAWDVGIR